MDSNENAMTSDSNTNKAFSIRDYALEARERDIHNNWPFDEKCMDFCVKLGVNKLLPPFESPDSVRHSLYRCMQSHDPEEPIAPIDSNDKCCQGTKEEKEFIKDDSSLYIDEAVSDITRQMSPLSLSSTKSERDDGGSAMPLTKCFVKKRNKRKGKHKMRSMEEIYAEARPCTLEECTQIYGTPSATVATVMPNICNQGSSESERRIHDTNGSMTTSDDDYKHESKGLKITHSISGNKGNGGFISENKHVIKFKLSGCKSQIQNRKAVP